MLIKNYWLVVVVIVFGLSVEAAPTLPAFAQGGADLKGSVESTGKNILDVILAIVGVVAIISIGVGALKIGMAKGEEGKTYIVSGIVALFISGSIYGIALLVR
jgi:hypothetical protein